MEAVTNDKQDSIKVSKGMNGKYSFETKLYYNAEKTKHSDIIAKLGVINIELKKKFGGA